METMQRYSFTIDFVEPHRQIHFESEEQSSVISDAAEQIRLMIESNSDLRRTLAEHGITLVMDLSH